MAYRRTSTDVQKVRKNFSTCESLVCVCEEDVGRTIREMCDDHVL